MLPSKIHSTWTHPHAYTHTIILTASRKLQNNMISCV